MLEQMLACRRAMTELEMFVYQCVGKFVWSSPDDTLKNLLPCFSIKNACIRSPIPMRPDCLSSSRLMHAPPRACKQSLPAPLTSLYMESL